ncbi:hypothetical protein CARUB_v10021733mg [Capsella rubella]|uniref:SWIM-type domain-containing protein n=2 Tax=Capsella rubella TaxID=81985 RepID=R0GEI4_9BRAS|nr:hypothetical protein CARUB_v10021733mg [Capsella rubella]
MSLGDFEDAVVSEFNVGVKKASFSFCPPNSMEFTTGARTPPVLVTTSSGLDYFKSLFCNNKCLNMFVKFGEYQKRGVDIATGNAESECGMKRGCGSYSSDILLTSSTPATSTHASKPLEILTTQTDADLLDDIEELVRETKEDGEICGGSQEVGDEWDEMEGVEPEETDVVVSPRVFASKEDCQIGIAIYTIKKVFHFRQTRTMKDCFVLNCVDERCDWRILACELRNSGYNEIKKASLDHTCPMETRSDYKKKATSRGITAVYKAKYSDPSKGLVPMELQQLVLEEPKVDASYSKCWRAWEKAQGNLFGTEEELYDKLADYLHALKLGNPSIVTDIKTIIGDDGKEKFLYIFLAFGASIQGIRHLRRVLVVDGTHLIGKYKGVLLTASGHDANFRVFPLAFAIVDSENDEAWTWFFQKVERITADSDTLTIISDCNQSIYTAKKSVFPKAKHGACIVHLARNVNARFHCKGLAKMVSNAGYAYTVGAFRGLVTPEVDKHMTKRMVTVKCSKVDSISSWSYEVVGLFGGKHDVLLDLKKCTCKIYDKDKIPCGHPMLASYTQDTPHATLVGEFYKTTTWAATYAGVISPELNAENIDLAEEIVYRELLPPNARRPSSRPKQARIPSIVEYPKSSSAPAKVQRCSRCKETGHNRTRCDNPI